MLLLGLGFVIGFPALNVQATNGVADDEQGLASGLVSTSGQLGAAVGLAAVSAVVTSRTGSATDAASMLNGFRPGIAVAAGIGLLGLIVALTGLVSERAAGRAALCRCSRAWRTGGRGPDRGLAVSDRRVRIKQIKVYLFHLVRTKYVTLCARDVTRDANVASLTYRT